MQKGYDKYNKEARYWDYTLLIDECYSCSAKATSYMNVICVNKSNSEFEENAAGKRESHVREHERRIERPNSERPDRYTKAKARGRKMNIYAQSKDKLILGKKSLLGMV